MLNDRGFAYLCGIFKDKKGGKRFLDITLKVD